MYSDAELTALGMSASIFLFWIFAALILAILAGFIARSKNRSGFGWFFMTFVSGIILSPGFGFLMMLGVGLAGRKESKQDKQNIAQLNELLKDLGAGMEGNLNYEQLKRNNEQLRQLERKLS